MSEKVTAPEPSTPAATSDASSSGMTPAAQPNGDATTGAPGVLYCVNHPGTETLLRCNRCERPICLKCAVLTDVGYRCKDCIRGVQASYFNAIPTDNLIGFGVAFIISAIAAPVAALLLAFIPFFFGIIIAFAIGSGAGGALAQIIRTSVGRRRGRYLRHFTLAGIILGVLVGGFVGLLFGVPVFSLTTLAFTILATATAYQILR